MRNLLVLLMLSLLLSSCATILNERNQVITVHTNNPSKIVYLSNTISTKKNKVKLKALRGKEPLSITAITDSTQKTVIVAPRNAMEYYANIFCNYGIGMLVDRNNPKRYTYPTSIYIDPADTITNSTYNRSYKRSQNKGALYLHISLPHVNSFVLRPIDEGIKANTGFFGISLGLDYYHQQDQFLNLSTGAVADIFIPVPAAVHYSGEREFMSSLYLTLSNNYNIDRFSLGYGLALTKNTWNYKYFGRRDSLSTRASVSKTSSALGLVFPAYYRIGRSFQIGVIYRPAFISLTQGISSRYEHVISLDLAWKIRLKK